MNDTLKLIGFQKNTVRIRLIDTGKIIDAGDYGFKKLPDDIKSIPACAILCKIEQVTRHNFLPIFFDYNMLYCLLNKMFVIFSQKTRLDRTKWIDCQNIWKDKYLTIEFEKLMKASK